MKKIFLNLVALMALVSFVSCDKDFNSLGANIVGGEHFTFTKYDGATVVSYSKATGAVQSNNLPINPLGIYKDPVFGLTKASFVSQVELISSNFTIGENPVIDSVYLYVPYFSHVGSISSTGASNYVLDSVYGYNQNAKFDLKVYENKYKLQDFDPNDNFVTAQKYYTNDKLLVDPYKGELLNTSSNVSQNTEFVISNKEIIIYKTDGNGVYLDENNDPVTDPNDVFLRVVKEKKAPGIWLDLKNSFFQQKILDQGASGVLLNNNIFKDHFKGLLFEVSETAADQGSLAMLDFTKAEIRVLYKTTVGTEDPVRKVFRMRMGYSSTSTCNSISFIEQGLKSSNYLAGLGASNELTGDSRLFLKGNDGSVAFIDLFGADGPDDGDSPDELDELREKNWLINQANLVFYIDSNTTDGMGKTGQKEPNRIYIFDATNNRPILDYYADTSTSTNIKNNKSGFGGIIEKKAVGSGEKRGFKYTFKLTEYINRLLNSNVEELRKNIRIGVAVTESINVPQNAYIKPGNLITIGASNVEFLPVASVLSPLGTVLHGSSSTDTYLDASGNVVPMKLKLEIYYTEPN